MATSRIGSLNLTRRAFARGLAAAGSAALVMPAILSARAYGEAKPGGRLTVALYKDLRTLNPIMGIFGNEWRTTSNLYNNLTRLTASGGVEGDLAESFTPSQDGAQWTFVLRDGVKFHDGTPLGAADVVATIEKILDPKTAAPYKAELGPIAAAKAIDRLSVRVELSSPYADLPKALAGSMARIVSERGIADFAKLDAAVYGTGPFVLKEFAPNDHVTMERNPAYFRSGRPFLDRLTLRVLPDTTAQTAALENREVDGIADVEADTFKRVAAIKGVNAIQVTGGTFNNIVLYANKPPFDDPRVRMALRLAMDRPQMTDAITGGVGTPAADEPISPSYEFFDKSLALRKPDLAKARQLLKEAGHGDGFAHKLVVSNSPASREKTAVVVQAMAEEIGIRFNIELMDNARYGATIWNKGIESYVGNYGTRPTEDAILSKLYSAKFGIDEGRWADSETGKKVEQLIEQGRQVTDNAGRRKIYAELQRITSDEGPFIIPNFFNSLFAAWSYVNDWPARAINTEMRLEDCWLAPDAPGRKA
ncbi:MAG TPA: ABC transporter substrate-binding protein [Alphaproteobacteria bacterium]|nr:ABC transporter substrate-binding protein [Alphaproteobacteria bacterium]